MKRRRRPSKDAPGYRSPHHAIGWLKRGDAYLFRNPYRSAPVDHRWVAIFKGLVWSYTEYFPKGVTNDE